jgi:hypothetical protein
MISKLVYSTINSSFRNTREGYRRQQTLQLFQHMIASKTKNKTALLQHGFERNIIQDLHVHIKNYIYKISYMYIYSELLAKTTALSIYIYIYIYNLICTYIYISFLMCAHVYIYI